MRTSFRRSLQCLMAAGLLPLSAQAGVALDMPTPAGSDFAATAVPLDELAGARGGNALNLAQLSEISEQATLSNNSVTSSMTGGNLLSGGAFAGSTGFATVIQNTGNNVLIQDALILNISLVQ